MSIRRSVRLHDAIVQGASQNEAPSGLKIRIPARIWNQYENSDLQSTSNPPPERLAKPASTGKSSRATHVKAARKPATKIKPATNIAPPPGTHLINHTGEPDGPSDGSGGRKDCKVRLSGFQYGGPNRQTRGQWQDKITFRTPCLKRSCHSCQIHRMHELILLYPALRAKEEHHGRSSQSNRTSNLSMNLSNSGPSRRLTVESLADYIPLELQSKEFRTDAPAIQSSLPLQPLKASLSTYHPPAKSRWLKEPRKRHSVHLRFFTPEGKQKFTALVLEKSRDRRRTQSSSSTTSSSSCRSRHRIKLVFRSGEGKQAFKDLVRKQRNLIPQNEGVAACN